MLATTEVELATAAGVGRFLPDLLARLGEVELRVPSLRERREDIALLAQRLLEQRRGRMPAGSTTRGFTAEAIRALGRQDWPRNLRQLEGVIEAASMLACDAVWIGVEHLPAELDA